MTTPGERRELHGLSNHGRPPVTTQIPTWREPSSPGRPGGERANPGTLVGGRYELRAPIGNGGMGTVWRATDSLLRRDVAVKEVLLPPTMPANERDALCERTLREARAAAGLSHPSVVQVYDVVIDSNRPWIVMELLEARSLADMVIDDGPLAARSVAKIGVALLGALEVAHAAGVLHRDVKPANVLICTDGRCVLTDFGVARMPTESKLTTPGMVLGSPHFISPERAVGGSFGPPSDLFSLGVTLYTAVEGGPPFDRGDPFETMRAVVEEPPRAPRLAGPLQPVLFGLLDKDPARRWTIDQSRALLRDLLSGPLARTGSTHARSDTDPQAVVRPPAGPPPAIRGSQVGGRAMLDSQQPLPGRTARPDGRQARPPEGRGRESHPPEGRGREPRPPEGRGREPRPPEGRGREPRPPEGRSRDPRPPEGRSRDPGPGLGPVRPGPDGRSGAFPLTGTGEWAAPQPPPRRERVGRRRAPSTTSVVVAKISRWVRATGKGIRQNRPRAMIVTGTVILVVIAAVGVLSGWFSGSSSAAPAPGGSASVTASATRTPLIAVQEFRDDRGIVVNVPKDWTRSASGSYVDFTDPAGGRKVRITIERTSATARTFLQAAGSGLKNPTRCPTPYVQIALRDASLAGQDGAELEYTCGRDADKRHGLWRAIVVDGTAYHFYLTVPDAQFAASKVIFDEMTASFQLL